MSRSLYNPTDEDVTIYSDKLGPNPQQFTLKKGDVKEFEDHIADLMEEELVNKLYWERRERTGRDKLLKELKELVRV